MYHKILSIPSNVLSDEQTICEIIAGRLSDDEVQAIIQAYQQRQLQEVDFNSQNFFWDLQGYLAQPQFNPGSAASMKQFLQSCGYPKIVNFGDDGWSKTAYLNKKNNEVIRLYYNGYQKFFYKKLLGTSEADISRLVGNNLLTVTVKNVAGTPFDLAERALPLLNVLARLQDKGQKGLIKQLEEVQTSNILTTKFIEGKAKNVGLVVRQDSRGQKRVYVVPFDLEPHHVKSSFGETEQMVVAQMQQVANGAQPKFLDYNQLIKYVPVLAELTAQPILTR